MDMIVDLKKYPARLGTYEKLLPPPMQAAFSSRSFVTSCEAWYREMGWKDAGLDELPLAKGDVVRLRGQGGGFQDDHQRGSSVGRTGVITYGPSDGYYKATWDDDGTETKEMKVGAFDVFREGLIEHSELQAVTDMLHLEVID